MSRTPRAGTARAPDVESNPTSLRVENLVDWRPIVQLGAVVFILLLSFCACFFSCVALGRVLHPHDIKSDNGELLDPTGEYVAALLSSVIFFFLFMAFVWFQDINIHNDLFRKYGFGSTVYVLSLITLGPASVALGSKILEAAVHHWHIVVKDVVVHYLTGYAILVPVPLTFFACCYAACRGDGIFWDGDHA
ncbi:hypothetical protein DL96DRAFT_348068 [Flagelloscypha sp. PMI_526]|nr:hypothetical protein DL96DRAFT_348068 [Flagelloscypha sp. PMI_526]